jgi:hypothetical protein
LKGLRRGTMDALSLVLLVMAMFVFLG